MFIRKIPFVIAIAALGIFVFSSVVMLLWNGIIPSVFHLDAITFWQAAGMLLLAKILFGGFRGRGWHGGGWRQKRMFMRWQNMTPEEKEKLRGFPGCHGAYKTAGSEL